MSVILILAIVALICAVLSLIPNYGVLHTVSTIILAIVLILMLSGVGRASISQVNEVEITHHSLMNS
jgi:hypothetical protein